MTNHLSVDLLDRHQRFVAVTITSDHPDALTVAGDELTWTGYLADVLDSLWAVETYGADPNHRTAARILRNRVLDARHAARRANALATRSPR